MLGTLQLHSSPPQKLLQPSKVQNELISFIIKPEVFLISNYYNEIFDICVQGIRKNM